MIGRARAVNACLQAGLAVFSHDDASQVRRDLDVMLAAPLAPRERVYALITVAEWHGREQQAGAARAALLEASTLATAHAFFDYQFRTAELLEQMDTPRTEPAVPSASEHWASSERHPALARLAARA